ncbi:c-type cytochrome [Tenacibaculum sp. IB213877]|uniref:c-type cytochrome n=1 Tax=Tenacibaculum sp. IB213877 TaxID=3097351 RepID=UPI002A59D17F|nr:c-type cytochrome [Tenacibaculum sp. IB213877]MDY0779298.1 c-type cytochrome [Tenacibaculum sp. IB213877]
MKTFIYSIVLSITFVLFSCSNKKEAPAYGKPSTTTKSTSNKTEPSKTENNQIAEGKKLFTEKTCTTCHQVDTKVIGPSIKQITKVYKAKDANIVAFLQSKSAPIVDTDPGQVAVMKANLDSFVKEMSEKELKAIEAYMLSIQ